ncbi:hypothetical protein [Hankyongella ginsenosidimutans]|uniref:hypothetical protein n=1 Tax=Hankyongella ginsenosidimutans TaxID=1763828 RepID=UPI001CA30139|nr:hypothetical protein [Hankyongella ginsenosidimutans]
MKWALAAGWSLTLATAVLAQPASAPPQPANLKPAGPKPSQLPTPSTSARSRSWHSTS